MKNPIIFTWQLISYFLIGIPLRLIFKIKTNVNFKINKDNTYILVSNHKQKIDPFLITYTLPLNVILKLIPFRFITTEKYFNNTLYKPILLLYGCIPANKKVLKKSIILLNKKETLFIFPTGGLAENEYLKPKVGMIYLEQNVPSSRIIPINISYISKYDISINYLHSQRHDSYPKNLQPLANNLYNLIKN